MEVLGDLDNITAYGLGTKHLKWSHIDEQVIADRVNEQLDTVEERFSERG